jgi:hypothetical protein
LWRSLVEIQLRYRHDHSCLDRSYTAQGARSFESHVRLVGEDGKPLERPAAVTRSSGLWAGYEFDERAGGE